MAGWGTGLKALKLTLIDTHMTKNVNKVVRFIVTIFIY